MSATKKVKLAGLSCLCAAVFLPSVQVAAEVVRVASGDAAALAAAVNAANEGDEIVVASGVYLLDHTISNKTSTTITLRGETVRPEDVVLDGQGKMRCLYLTSKGAISGGQAEPADAALATRVKGLTIRNGFVDDRDQDCQNTVAGGGLFIKNGIVVTAFDVPHAQTGADDLVSMERLLVAPAGRNGFVRAVGDRFENDAGEIRFFGVNFTGAACFPPREEAEAEAARLARLGVNCVRFHYMDAVKADWERFDALAAALRRRGIHWNFNLHVAHVLGEAEGLPKKAPPNGKIVSVFHPQYQAWLRDFARALLCRVNPRSGIRWRFPDGRGVDDRRGLYGMGFAQIAVLPLSFGPLV